MSKKGDPNLGLNEEEFERFRRACNATWQAIGGDCSEANGGKSMPRSTVVELVLDADRIEMYGGDRATTRDAPNDWTSFYATRLRPWIIENYGSAAFKKLMARVFPYKLYE